MKTLALAALIVALGLVATADLEDAQRDEALFKFHDPDPDGRVWYSADNKIWEPDCPYLMDKVNFEVIP